MLYTNKSIDYTIYMFNNLITAVIPYKIRNCENCIIIMEFIITSCRSLGSNFTMSK